MDIKKPHFTELRWPTTDEITAFGRNGHIKTSGVQVRALDPHPHFPAKIELRPVTGKGVAAENCNLEIPYTPEVLGELAIFFAYHQSQALALKCMESERAEDQPAAAPAKRTTRP